MAASLEKRHILEEIFGLNFIKTMITNGIENYMFGSFRDTH